ncbi:hypothetical protein RB2501_12417 [Robiginitalea biformata HTCC2501]|uniref:Uncharacterized protein n=1 Tax=Robiginitalea biformata (strain ATCC BAA-864 / DSM 15991 / KCTC 12146 / HTCC2501) TaxID=313596 RepID=A4CN90_ROBBH|nr:hypothetical protein RB2501_12417 [Robiginitalea biformata HTCC2501]
MSNSRGKRFPREFPTALRQVQRRPATEKTNPCPPINAY